MKLWGKIFGFPQRASINARALILLAIGALAALPTAANAAWWQTD